MAADKGNESAEQSGEEIHKYLDILSRDPKSRVFAPLAEAYRKAGLLDEAIETAREGLKNHPSYLGGRVALGRALLEKDLHAEALEEFTQVVQAAPDNLMAHKHLGRIHLHLNHPEDAEKAFRMVLLLDSRDEEAQKFLEGGPSPALTSPTPPEPSVPREEPASVVEPAPEPEEQAVEEIPENLEAADETVFSSEPLFDPAELETQGAGAGPEEPPPDGEDSPFEIFTRDPADVRPTPPEGETQAAVAERGFSEAVFEVEDLGEEMDDVAVLDLSSEMAEFEEEPLPPPDPRAEAEEPGVAPDAGPGGIFDTEVLAELYINQGFYKKAAEVYSRLLRDRPGDNSLKQKLEEVLSLERMGGVKAPPPRPEEAPAPSPAPPAGGKEGGGNSTVDELQRLLDALKEGPR